jgi:GMP synthase-like glutamine amidotransferase
VTVVKRGNWVAIQHVSYEDPGLIAGAASQRGIELQLCHPYHGEPLPSWEEIDGLVVMGGPMGVQDNR